MTAENKKDDMTSVIVEMLDLLKEIMADAPYEIASDVDWNYNSWFEDLNFDLQTRTYPTDYSRY
jgi:hypothetical protein